MDNIKTTVNKIFKKKKEIDVDELLAKPIVNDTKICYSNEVEYFYTNLLESHCREIKDMVNHLLVSLYKLSIKGFYLNFGGYTGSISKFDIKNPDLELIDIIKKSEKYAMLYSNLVTEIIISDWFNDIKDNIYYDKKLNFNVENRKEKLQLIKYFTNIISQNLNDFHINRIKVSNPLVQRIIDRSRSKKKTSVKKSARKTSVKKSSRKTSARKTSAKKSNPTYRKSRHKIKMTNPIPGTIPVKGGGPFMEVTADQYLNDIKELFSKKYEILHDFGSKLKPEDYSEFTEDTKLKTIEALIKKKCYIDIESISRLKTFEPRILYSLINSNLGIDDLSNGIYNFISRKGKMTESLDQLEIDLNSTKPQFKIINNIGFKAIREFIEDNINNTSDIKVYQLDGLDGVYIPKFKKTIKNIMIQNINGKPPRRLINILPKLWDPVSATPKEYNFLDYTNYLYNYCNVFDKETYRYIYITYNNRKVDSWIKNILQVFNKKQKNKNYITIHLRNDPLTDKELDCKTILDRSFEDMNSYSNSDFSIDLNSGFSIAQITRVYKSLESVKGWGGETDVLKKLCYHLYKKIELNGFTKDKIWSKIKFILLDLKKSGDWGQVMFSNKNALKKKTTGSSIISNTTVPLITNDNLCACASIMDQNPTLFGTSINKVSIMGIFSGVKVLNAEDIKKYIINSLNSNWLLNYDTTATATSQMNIYNIYRRPVTDNAIFASILKTSRLGKEFALKEAKEFLSQQMSDTDIEKDIKDGTTTIGKIRTQVMPHLNTDDAVSSYSKTHNDYKSYNLKNYENDGKANLEGIVIESNFTTPGLGKDYSIVLPQDTMIHDTVCTYVSDTKITTSKIKKTTKQILSGLLNNEVKNIIDLNKSSNLSSSLKTKLIESVDNMIALIEDDDSFKTENFKKIKIIMNLLNIFYYFSDNGKKDLLDILSSIGGTCETIHRYFNVIVREKKTDFDQHIEQLRTDLQESVITPRRRAAPGARNLNDIERLLNNIKTKLFSLNIDKPTNILSGLDYINSLFGQFLEEESNPIISNQKINIAFKDQFKEKCNLKILSDVDDSRKIGNDLKETIQKWTDDFITGKSIKKDGAYNIPVLDNILANLENIDDFYKNTI